MKDPKIKKLRTIEQYWQECTIRQKITFYMVTVFVCIFLSVLFNIWVAGFSLGDFNNILSESSKSSAFVQAMDDESKLFEQYMKNRTKENELLLKEAMEETKKSVEDLTFNYRLIGEERYSKTWNIRSCYEVYVEERDAMLQTPQGTLQYVDQLYIVYEIQDYLRGYAAEMMSLTTMKPATRRLIRISPEDEEKTYEMFDILLGDNIIGRKDFIAKNGAKYLELADY
jgi:sensor c-di-GMP phosphodiesterase-like protein